MLATLLGSEQVLIFDAAGLAGFASDDLRELWASPGRAILISMLLNQSCLTTVALSSRRKVAVRSSSWPSLTVNGPPTKFGEISS